MKRRCASAAVASRPEADSATPKCSHALLEFAPSAGQHSLNRLRSQGLYKTEHGIEGPQAAKVEVSRAGRVLNLCANNYLGLAKHPEIVAAAHEALDRWGFGMASVRFICGTQEMHASWRQRLSEFLGTEDTILYSSCFDANGGLFETLLGAEDAIISDELNHASIIDGVRLCKAQRLRYKQQRHGRAGGAAAGGGRTPASG